MSKLSERVKTLETALRQCASLTRYQHEDSKTVREVGERVQAIVREALNEPPDVPDESDWRDDEAAKSEAP